MTEPTDFEAVEQLLPGLEPPRRGASELELATRRTIAALDAAGLLSDQHAMLCRLMLDLAEVVDAGRRGGKASAAAMAAAQLLATYQLLIPDREGGEGEDAFDRLARELGSAATVRDAPEPRSS